MRRTCFIVDVTNARQLIEKRGHGSGPCPAALHAPGVGVIVFSAPWWSGAAVPIASRAAPPCAVDPSELLLVSEQAPLGGGGPALRCPWFLLVCGYNGSV